MELRDLSYFEVIAETGHMGRAAEKLGRTQPALTKSVRRLEQEIGADLFTRAGRGLRLTEAGKALVARSRSIRLNVEESLRELADMARGLTGTLRIGTGATTAEYILPAVMRDLLAEAPQARIEIAIGMNDVLRESLAAGMLDILVGPLAPRDEDRFDLMPLGKDAVVVAVARDHPLTRRAHGPQDLLDYGWVLPAGSVATRQWLDAAFAARGLLAPKVTIQTNNISLSPRLVAATDLITFISRRNLGPGRVGEPLTELPGAGIEMLRPVGVVMARGGYTSPLKARFLRLLETEARQVLQP